MEPHLTKKIITFSDGSYQTETFAAAPTGTMQFYQHKEDKESGAFLNNEGKPIVRTCASTGGCPAVFVLKTPLLKVHVDKQWQFYLVAINYNMALEDVSSLLDKNLAFCNQTGWRSEPLRNYILNKDLTSTKVPRFDKDRTCSRSILRGVEIGSSLRVTTFNGNLLPPLKPGRTYPQTLLDINLDDYLYNPREHPWMFFVANTIATKPGNTTSVAPFPRGALYGWTNDNTPYTWLPHVSRETIYYPLSKLIKLPLGSPLPSPYRIVR